MESPQYNSLQLRALTIQRQLKMKRALQQQQQQYQQNQLVMNKRRRNNIDEKWK